jgi:hypothetical protein
MGDAAVAAGPAAAPTAAPAAAAAAAAKPDRGCVEEDARGEDEVARLSNGLQPGGWLRGAGVAAREWRCGPEGTATWRRRFWTDSNPRSTRGESPAHQRCREQKRPSPTCGHAHVSVNQTTPTASQPLGPVDPLSCYPRLHMTKSRACWHRRHDRLHDAVGATGRSDRRLAGSGAAGDPTAQPSSQPVSWRHRRSRRAWPNRRS